MGSFFSFVLGLQPMLGCRTKDGGWGGGGWWGDPGNERRLEKWTISFTSHFVRYSEEDAV